jgi:tRNA threonylcarbamoyladenosine biosynthesis protein TsaB
MKILSLECSAKSASCAVIEESKILCSDFTSSGLTHSQTLLPMVSDMINKAEVPFSDIDAFAVSAGPGSFTGIRIGISAVKGMALPKNAPCIPVSTLEAIAYNFLSEDALVCAVMDARCNQVYNALFRIKDGKIKRLCEDRAVSIDFLKAEILKSRVRCKIIVAGDGADLFFPFVKSKKNVIIADQKYRLQNGEGVAKAAEVLYKKGVFTSAEQLLPIYLRLPQAERELKLKKETKK